MHAAALEAAGNAELVAVYDKAVERAQKFAGDHKVRAAESFEAFLADSEIEAVTIATPTGIHGAVALPAAAAGKHILCEKPLDVTLEKSDAIIKACHQNNVTLAAVFQSRFGTAVQLLKKAIDAGRFGQMVLASTKIHWFRSQQYYDSAGWRGTWELDGGGALMNQSIHTVDLLVYLNGSPAEVFAYTDTLTHTGIEVEDTAAAVVKFKNGALGTIEASTSCAPGFPRQIEISGENGSVLLEDDRILRWEFTEELPEDAEIRANGAAGEGMYGGAGDPMAINYEGHRRQIEDLADAIINKKSPKLPGQEGRRAVELICGIYESARTGKPVKF
ncbi:Gfo/Idh/MocA family oxidoreductase [Lentisphaerota bacterium]|nr:Gfo/Idh/MocA family oxidoreductase [Lentisphaerota bacterium]